MATKTEVIIKNVEQNYPQNSRQFVLENIPDVGLGIQSHLVNQYIIGVTPSDQFTNDISNYKFQMKASLSTITENVECLAWPFSGYEQDEMKQVLLELSAHYNVKVDADKMIADLKMHKEQERSYYIVVTVVQYEIAFV